MAEGLCRKFLISGKVQGVFFRASTCRQAQSLDIVGHAINLDDGRVEVLACGSTQSLEHLADWLQQGPTAAQVSGVEVHDIALDNLPEGFSTG